jgi:PEP-CTERM motif
MVIVLGVIGAERARAELVTTANEPYKLTISESTSVLSHPDNAFDQKLAGATTGHALEVERSEPYFMLTNTSNSSLTEFQMSIGNTDDHFRFVQFTTSGSSAGVSMTVVQPTAGSSSNEITIEFTGLAQGETVEFRVGIAANEAPPNSFADYRDVFFNNGTGSNSVTTVDFANPALNTTSTLADQGIAGALAGHNTGGAVQAFQFTGTAGSSGTGSGGTINPTPEPSSIVLLCLGLIGLFSVAWRRRRAAWQAGPILSLG